MGPDMGFTWAQDWVPYGAFFFEPYMDPYVGQRWAPHQWANVCGPQAFAPECIKGFGF